MREWLKQYCKKKFDKKWEKIFEKKMAPQYRNLTKEEIEAGLEAYKAEIRELMKDDDYTIDDVIALREKHDEFLCAVELIQQYRMEKRLSGY